MFTFWQFFGSSTTPSEVSCKEQIKKFLVLIFNASVPRPIATDHDLLKLLLP